MFLIALLVVGITTFAQEKGADKSERVKLTVEQKVDIQVKRISKDLELNEKQIKDVRNLVAKEMEKRESMKGKMHDITKTQRAEIKTQMEAEQAAVNSEMKKILTPVQYAKWVKIRDEMKEKMKEKMAERAEKRDNKELPVSK